MSRAWAEGSTPAWRRIRAQVLQRDRYRCQVRLPGCLGQASQVHHTLGRLVTGDDPRYLVASCHLCNTRVGDPLTQPDPPPHPRTRW